MLAREEVLKIARLARLELTEDEVQLYQKQLDRVLEYVRELASCQTPNDTFVRHVPRDSVAMREDKAMAFANTSGLMANAPKEENKQFLIPTIVERS